MLHPSYSDLMKAVNDNEENTDQATVNSRYSIVIATSKRARQLIDELGEEQSSEGKCFKPLSMAVDELYDGEVKILGEDDFPEDEILLEEEMVSKQPEETEASMEQKEQEDSAEEME